MNLTGDFITRRRQPYINQTSYGNTLKILEGDSLLLLQKMQAHAGNSLEVSTALGAIASDLWFMFQLKITAGADIRLLAIISDG